MAKVGKVNASHGPFSLLFCIGQFFSSSERDNGQLQPFLSGLTPLPVPTFFIAGDEQHHALIDGLSAGGELCPGLTYLGRAGVAKLGGLSVGFLSGLYDSERYFDVDEEQRLTRYDAHYVEDDVIKLSKEAAGESQRSAQLHCNAPAAAVHCAACQALTSLSRAAGDLPVRAGPVLDDGVGQELAFAAAVSDARQGSSAARGEAATAANSQPALCCHSVQRRRAA